MCESLIITDGDKNRGEFGLASDSSAMLKIYGDDGKTPVAYLGGNATNNNEMMFQLLSQSKTDKRAVGMAIGRNGGRFDGHNKMGEDVARLVVGDDGGGVLDLRDKFGYRK